ncbi:FAD-dependent oxidoreductase [Synechocystis sp. CS-94]|nr:amine oxidase [Synechocystis sp. PCC 6714]MCT0254126.1 FAD-dependent oxidoreductase [Synechocystis sp. CS-94]
MIRRRSFLKLSQLMFVSYLLSTSCGKNNTPVTASDAPSILIIGAGLAGLAAAQSLMKQGYAVRVLEARNRLGGRTWTSNYWEDAPLDMGASWIQGTEDNPITKLAEKIATPLVMTSYDNAITYGVGGQPFTAKEEQIIEQLEKKWQGAIATAQNGDTDQSLQAVIENTFSLENQPLGTKQIIDWYMNSTIEHEYASSLEDTSTYWFDADGGFGGDDAIFVEGYQAIVNYLAKDILIEFNQIVESIDYSEEIPTVITNQRTYTADQVIITLPLGVLKSGQVKFIPELPSSKQKAIKILGMGVLNKCYLRFPKVFWPKKVDWIEQVPTQRGLWSEWVNIFRVNQLPILLGFNAANEGKEIETWTNEEIVESAMETLRHLFGDDIPDPTDYQITRWQSDPFSRGSYSFNALGSHPNMRDHLAKSLNDQIFFAGEATERDYFATAHGAYLSGLRVAEEINNL